MRQFGKKGKGEGELDQPVSVAVDSHNVVCVGEYRNNRISIFSTDGEFITSFGSEGNGHGQFNRPYGIVLDKNAAVYVVIQTTNIYKFLPDSTITAAVIHDCSKPFFILCACTRQL